MLVIGQKGAKTLAHMRWWTTRSEYTSKKCEEGKIVLVEIDQRWGKEIIHLWDRGFAGNPWLTQTRGDQQRKTLLGASKFVGCTPPLYAPNKNYRFSSD